MLRVGTLAEAVVFLLIPKKWIPGQMFSNYEILHIRFKLPLGKTREDLLVRWKLILPGITENRRGREQSVEYVLIEPYTLLSVPLTLENLSWACVGMAIWILLCT